MKKKTVNEAVFRARLGLKILVILLLTGITVSCGKVAGGESYTLTGSVHLKGIPVTGVRLTLVGEGIGTERSESGSDGVYSFTGLWNGTYTVTAAKQGYKMVPAKAEVVICDGNVTVGAFEVVPLWDKSIGSADDDWATALVSDGTGGYIIAGTRMTGYNNPDGYVARLGFDGSVLWEKTFGSANADRFSAVTQCGSSFLLVGTTEQNGNADIYLVCIDGDGNKVTSWGSSGERILGTAANEYGTCVAANDDGSCIVAGYGYNGSANQDDIIALTLSKTGEAGSFHYYGGTDADYAYSVCRRVNSLGDNEYVLAGARSIAGTGRDIYVVKLDKDLGKLWGTSVDKSGEDEARAVCICTNGTIAVTGYQLDAEGARNIWVGLFTAEGGLSQDRSIGGSCDDTGTSIVPVAGGGFAVAGYSVNETLWRSDLDYCLASFGADLSLAWMKQYDRGSQMNDYCMGVITTLDGGFAVAGYSSTATSKNDMWIIKRDENGSAGGE